MERCQRCWNLGTYCTCPQLWPYVAEYRPGLGMRLLSVPLPRGGLDDAEVVEMTATVTRADGESIALPFSIVGTDVVFADHVRAYPGDVLRIEGVVLL